VVDTALADGWAAYGWQSCAWSRGVVSQRAHLYQRLRATVANPISGTDENIVLRPFPLWTKASSSAASDIPPIFTKPAPAPKPVPAPPKGLTVQTIDLRNADRVTVKGPGVKPLQRLLGVTVDGLAGRNTKAALHAFQSRVFGAAGADDIFGPQTAEALLAGK
jgi:peptidoglycan hydrolase-like protein with peptidoglycan-binding domain